MYYRLTHDSAHHALNFFLISGFVYLVHQVREAACIANTCSNLINEGLKPKSKTLAMPKSGCQNVGS